MIEPRKLLPVLGGAGLLIAFQQSLDILTAAAGVDLATPLGRVRLVTLLWSRNAPILLADAFLISAAIGLGHARSLALLAKVHLASGVLLLLAIPFLLRSAGGMASTLGGSSVGVFRVTVARALLGLALLGCGALVGWRALSDFREPTVP